MENNNQDNRWVDERMSALKPRAEWTPDTAKGLARMRDRRDSRKAKGRRWMPVVAMGVAASLGLMAFPEPRAFAGRCLDFCTTELSHHSLMEVHNWLFGSFLSFLHPGGEHGAVGARHDARHKIAPDFTLTDASGKAVRLSDYKGKVVLLNFWATWCAPCREETPWFVEFQEKYRDRGFLVLGVSLDDDGWKSVKPFAEAKHVNYPVVVGNDKTSELYGVENLPETMIIDRSGRIALNCTGLIGKEEYQKEIEGVL